MRVYINQLIREKLWVVLVVGVICITTVAEQPQEKQQPDRDATIKILVDGFKPWIRQSDFTNFVHRLSIPEEMESIATKQYEQYKQQGNILKQTAAVELYRVGFKEVVETGGDLLETNSPKSVQEIQRKMTQCSMQVTHKLIRHRDTFFEELREHIEVQNDTWSSALLWVRRQNFLRGTDGGSWADLSSFPDMMDVYDLAIQDDKDLSILVNPSTKAEEEVAKIVQVLLEDWALQTDAFVDTYLIQRIRWYGKRGMGDLSPDRNAWLSAWRRSRVNQQRRIKLYSVAEDIATAIEPVVGQWATERWRQTIRATIFPQSCQQNSFELHYATRIDNGTFDEKDVEFIEQHALPLQQKMSKLRSLLCKVALWYGDYLIPKLKEYDVPTFPINLQYHDEKYLETVDAMIDILCERLSPEDSVALKAKIKESRKQNGYVDHPYPNSRGLFESLSGSQ